MRWVTTRRSVSVVRRVIRRDAVFATRSAPAFSARVISLGPLLGQRHRQHVAAHAA
jgi:hypothetical protein